MKDKVLVLDFGGSFLKYALIDDKFNFYHKSIVETPNKNEEIFVATIRKIYETYKDEIRGIGISLGGKINSQTGIVMSSGQFPFFNGRSITKILSELIPIKITVENDGICAGLAEYKEGSLKGCQNALVVIFGTGIGGAAILDGKFYKGTRNCGVEFSLLRSYSKSSLNHTWFMYGGIATGLINIARELGLPNDIDGLKLFELVHSGDEKAIAALDKYCDICIVYLYNLQAIFDVETIAIGGGISNQKILIDKLNEKLKAMFDSEAKYQLPPTMPRLISCKYKNDANLIGAYLVHILENY